jgi:alginate O-acetyltransferase complex protein AlgI
MFIFLWCCYFAFTGFTDLFTGSFMLTGIRVSEMFEKPYLSRSPRDFWGKRWNLYFRDLAHRNIFIPAGGSRRPVLATFLVFFVSGIFHEYLIIMSVGFQKVGWMLAFFMAHWLGTVIQTAVGRWAGKKEILPLPLAIGFYTLWMLITLPLLAEPLLLVVPVHTWHLW